MEEVLISVLFQASGAIITRVDELSPLLRELLEKRGISEDADVSEFLSPDYGKLHDPFLMPQMREACARIFLALEKDERIAAYADFDCDGIPGAALLHDLFKKTGHENFEVYIPHRDREGYGLHREALRRLRDRGATLLITVDVGTVALDAIAYARSIGLDVIVTDHHEILGELPDAIVLNPKRGPYPFPDLCGTGVAFKLACALLREGRAQGLDRFKAIPEGYEKWLLDLVAIATVADMVPLAGENRTLAFWGLQVLRKSRRAGIDALCSGVRLRKDLLDESDIGFSLAPRVNAASRMDSPELAFRLLTTHDRDEADKIARELEKLNASRKAKVAAIVREAKKRAGARYQKGDRAIVLGDPSWKPALLGLAANSIAQEFGACAFLWGRDASGNLKGSARAGGGFSVIDIFTATRESFLEFGGHRASGGFSVSRELVHQLPENVARAAAGLEEMPPVQEGSAHDAVATLREANHSLLKEVSRLAPFGIGNAKPVLRIARAQVLATKSFGKESNHVEVLLTCLDSGVSMRAFDFFRTPEQFTEVPVARKEVTALASLERDSFRGPDKLALRLIDILPA